MLDIQLGFHEVEDDLLDCRSVGAVWTFHCSENTQQHIVPDGRTDLIFSFEVGANGTINNVEPIIVPPFLMAHTVFSRAHQGYLGIRFKPGSGGAVLNTPLRPVMGELIAGLATLRYAPWLRDLRRTYRNVHDLLAFLNQFFARQPDAVTSSDVAEALAFLDEKSGEARIGDLARALGIPVRTLNRRFTHHVALSPKQYAQTMRLRQAVQRLSRDRAVSADVAVDCGFSDQAHMTREVRRFMGHTPRQLNALVQEGNLLS